MACSIVVVRLRHSYTPTTLTTTNLQNKLVVDLLVATRTLLHVAHLPLHSPAGRHDHDRDGVCWCEGRQGRTVANVYILAEDRDQTDRSRPAAEQIISEDGGMF